MVGIELVSSSDRIKMAYIDAIQKELKDTVVYLPFAVDSKIDFYNLRNKIIKDKSVEGTKQFFDLLLNLNQITSEEFLRLYESKDAPLGVIVEVGPAFTVSEGLNLLYKLWKEGKDTLSKENVKLLSDKFKATIYDVVAMWSYPGVECIAYAPTLFKQHSKETFTEFVLYHIVSLLKDDSSLGKIPFRLFSEELGHDSLEDCFTFALEKLFVVYDYIYILLGKKKEFIEFLEEQLNK